MKSVQLSIPEPCHENWQNMTPNEQGRFCNACSKTVVDFSMMSDYEVLNYFSTISDKKVCGRALPAQLNREMTMPREPKKRRYWYWNYIAMFFMLFSKSGQIKAQTKGEVVTVPVKKPNCNIRMGAMVAPKPARERIVSGKVTNSDGSPIPSATVQIRGTQTKVGTDFNGNYSIKVTDWDVLEFSGIGYETQRQSIHYEIKTADAVLRPAMTGGIVVVAGYINRDSGGDESVCSNTRPNQVYEIKIKDKETLRPVGKALLVVAKAGVGKSDSRMTNEYGTYKLRKIKDGDVYKIIVSAEGYEDQELTVEGVRTDPGKIVKQVFLLKKPDYKTLSEITVSTFGVKREARMVGSVTTTRIDTKDVLQPGKITNTATVLGGVIKGMQVSLKKPDEKKSMIKTIARKVTDTLRFARPAKINLYPNPVQRGKAFLVSLDLPQTGNIDMQIADITGRVILQKQINISSKDHVEKIETDSRWPAGMYFLNVSNSNGGQQGGLIGAVSFVVQ